jgi:hypothetical protein
MLKPHMEEAVPPRNDRDPRAGRGTYVVAGLIALAPLLLLGAAAPGGGQWRWLEVPSRMTMIAAAIGIAACFARSRAVTIWVLLGSVAGAFLWDLVRAYIGLEGLDRMDLIGDDLSIVASNNVKLVAPWLVGALYGALAWLAIRRADAYRPDGIRHTLLDAHALRAALWLLVVCVVAMVLTASNKSWLTLENLGNRGTFRSSVSWPDTKILSMVIAALVSVVSATVALRAWRARAVAPALPRAMLRE